MVKSVRKLKQGRVTYLCWCDDEGDVVDDGTVHRLGPTHYRVTAAEPTYSWFLRQAEGFDVAVEDVTDQMGALAVQGPRARDVLDGCADTDMNALRFFGVVETTVAGAHVWISRTGYTGDLGYEVWVARADALRVYDAVLEAGRPHGAIPAGLDAMDVARVEAAFIMNGVDYYSANHCLIDAHKSNPYELGLDWTVKLDREPFVGQAALRRIAREGAEYAFVGLVADWDEYEALFAKHGLPPGVPSAAQREGVPIYDAHGAQVGRATTRAWSPTLKQYLAIGQVYAHYGAPGTELRLEVTAEWERQQVKATVTPTPFFDPERKRKP